MVFFNLIFYALEVKFLVLILKFAVTQETCLTRTGF